MFRSLLASVAIAILSAIGVWLSPEGLIETLLMLVVGIDLMYLTFAGFIGTGKV